MTALSLLLTVTMSPSINDDTISSTSSLATVCVASSSSAAVVVGDVADELDEDEEDEEQSPAESSWEEGGRVALIFWRKEVGEETLLLSL